MAVVVLRRGDPALVCSDNKIDEEKELDDEEERRSDARDVAVREDNGVGQQEGRSIEEDPETQLDGGVARHERRGALVRLVAHAEQDEGERGEVQLHGRARCYMHTPVVASGAFTR